MYISIWLVTHVILNGKLNYMLKINSFYHIIIFLINLEVLTYMEVRYINPFLAAVQKVFDTMIDVPFVLGQPVVKKDRIPSHEVSSIIGLSGEVTGSVVISLEENIALELASALLGDEFTEMNDDCTDAIGEIANMIAGNAKTDFPGENNAISVPTVVIGRHKLSYPKGIPIISIPCKAGNGELTIDIALKIN